MLLLIHCHSLQAKYAWPYVITSRPNDLHYIVNTPTRRKKKTNMSSDNTKLLENKYKLTVDASDAGVGAVLL